MSHNMRLKNFSRHVVELQHAKEDGTLRVTTEEAGAVIARYVPNERVILYYNLYAETVQVLVYDSVGGLTPVAKHETNQPLVLAAALAKKYPVGKEEAEIRGSFETPVTWPLVKATLQAWVTGKNLVQTGVLINVCDEYQKA